VASLAVSVIRVRHFVNCAAPFTADEALKVYVPSGSQIGGVRPVVAVEVRIEPTLTFANPTGDT